MKLLVCATALCFLMAVPTYAHQQEQQQQQQDKDKQKQDERQRQQDERQRQETDRQQEDRAKQNERARQEDKATRDERSRQDRQSERDRQDQDRRQREMNRENDRNARSETHNRTISQREFRERFGREHHFRVGHADNRRFAYGGYTFEYVDAWPEGWGYDDDFYIDYIDGQYYLIDLAHPDVRLVVMIVD